MKNIILLLAGALIGAAIVYFGVTSLTPREALLTMGPVEYNCELSSGIFKNGSCVCPLESGQTQAEMYDEQTGFCQSSIGGPAGDAFQASVGLPYGDYGYYQGIIIDLCESSGGSMSGAACVCSAGDSYNKATGQCK